MTGRNTKKYIVGGYYARKRSRKPRLYKPKPFKAIKGKASEKRMCKVIALMP